ncbi:unnamed protein product [Urochloa decumbens]|uniref:F-box domain-containing protein n=1 Tax=Urochloa decumbens TaxID=240449 RepID=A0ABC9G7D4_9POAL
MPLPDELIEEVLTRLPPDDPTLLVRTALVCKGWCRLISSPGFRHRFPQFHRTPALLDYIYLHDSSQYFVPTSSFRLPHAIRSEWSVINARRGRVLVLNKIYSRRHVEKKLIVWDPTTDEQLRLPMPPFNYENNWNAALLCAAPGCNHSDCPWGPFLVVFVRADDREDGTVSASVYSSEQGAWREPISIIHHHGRCRVYPRGPNAHVRNATYFGWDTSVVEYDFGKQELSTIRLPYLCCRQHFVLMTAENSGLGFATVCLEKYNLCLWSRVAGLGGHATWAQQRVIELDKLRALSTPYVCTVGIDNDVGVVFIWAANDLFTINLRSNRVEEVGNVNFAFGVVPYTNFCTLGTQLIPSLLFLWL